MTNQGQFKPGRSGNPQGRPKVDPEVMKKLRDASPEAVDVLITIMKDEKEKKKIRLEAASRVLDRAWGRPAQALDIQGEMVTAEVQVDSDKYAEIVKREYERLNS